MPEHQQTQQSTESKTTFQRQATPLSQTPASNPFSIIQRAKINPKSLTYADVMQLQRTIGNRAVGMLLTGIENTSTVQQAPVQKQEIPEEEETCPSCMQRQEILEEEEPLQGKMAETVQRQEIPEEEEPLQGKMIGTVQRQEIPEEEEPLQGKFENKPEQMTYPSCFAAPIVQKQELEDEEKPLQGKTIEIAQRQEIPEEEEPLKTKMENNTGMPDNLKAGVENLSGIDMSDVRVHYNSLKPAKIGALAYTQGKDIDVAPGQERHLPHEAWHVVQQMQGRVKPTMQMKDGIPVNDDEGLEHEADVIGGQIADYRLFRSIEANANQGEQVRGEALDGSHRSPLQVRVPPVQAKPEFDEESKRYFDNFLGSYIDQKSVIKGYSPWEKFYQEAEKSWWIYMPETEYRSEKYVRHYAEKDYLDKLKEADENEMEDHNVKRELESGNWEHLTVTKKLSENDGKHLKAAMIQGIKDWDKKRGELFEKINNLQRQIESSPKNDKLIEDKKTLENISNMVCGIFPRISNTFSIIIQRIGNEIELTPDLIKKVNGVLSPSIKAQLAEKDIMKASQALAELDYAALVISTKKLDAPFILGAQSRVRSLGQKALPQQEETHGNLPPLGVLNMEVDAYYLDADGKLHADEVKDTPNALAEKAKDGGQIGRQIKWLTWDVINPKTKQSYNKEVHYFVRAEGPKFDSVLSEEVINNLSQLEIFQMGVQFIHIGSHSYMPQELKELYDKAIAWLKNSNLKLKERGIKPSKAATDYFGDLSTTLKSIEKGPLV